MFEDNNPESCITDGIPHLSFMDPETRTQFTWCGDPDHQIEVSPAYGEPVVERIPIPVVLRRPVVDQVVTMLDVFSDVCEAYTKGRATASR